MSEFTLNETLARDSAPVLDLPLCTLRLSHNAAWPWLILIPRRPDLVELLDVSEADSPQLWAEIRQTSRALQRVTGCYKLNVAALGNRVRQLHIHVIARVQGDPAWPNPIWGTGHTRDYAQAELKNLTAGLIAELS